MKIPPPLHDWSVSPKEAVAIQKELAKKVSLTPPAENLRLIAGVDACFTKDKECCIAGVVVWDSEEARVVETAYALVKLEFPYIPGLLSFREAPAVLAALEQLRATPDVLMCDGHGLAHPRHFGIACHIGVLLDMPALGCGKSRLVGMYQEPGMRRGATSPLLHNNEHIGTMLRTRDKVKPVFISVGHKLDLATAENVVLKSLGGFRLPEPTRLADKMVAEIKKSGKHCAEAHMD